MTSTLSLRCGLAIAITALVLPLSAMAQSQGGPPPEPDFKGMANALGVKESAVKSCMPAPKKGERPQKPNVQTVTNCLMADNPSLTADKVGATLEQFRPAPPKK